MSSIEGALGSEARPTAWHGRPIQEGRYPDALCSVCLAVGPEEFAYPMKSDEKNRKMGVQFPGSRRDILTRMGSYTGQIAQ